MSTARRFVIEETKATHEMMAALTDVRLVRNLAYINGKWISGEQFNPVYNPASDEIVGYSTQLSCEQMEQAVLEADNAFKPWRQLQADQRGEYLMRWYQLILEAKQDLAHLMVIEQGKTYSEALGEIEYGASFVRWFAEEARRSYGETIPSHIPNAQLSTIREPIGVAALITPWNFPNAMITRKAAAAMAIGCPVLIKPASETPFSALALAELADRAGIPAGIFNIVTGKASTFSHVVCQSDKVKALSFTGSTPIGKLLLSDAASTVKKCSMELGGNAPFIVLPDMDIAQAAQAAADAKFQTSGQDCLAANRIFVHHAHYDAFLEHFAQHVEQQVVGNGLDPDVTVGPLINRKAAEKAMQLLNDALSKGARIVAQSPSAKGHTSTRGNFFPPTLLADVTPDMAVYREENFCPLAAVLPYHDIDQVIEKGNDTEYGLAAYVYGHDIHDIWRCMRGLEFGMISVNSVKMTGHPIPFGGMKQSGLGREGSQHGFDEFSEIKYCCLGALPTASGS
ncbi:NAD-dependent succinate-semialdehyde dehydrogenase [Vibrio scophthalmi]|uniref:NAD-dependent succinate-semialdehyde dehydrogenase n=1 Tax=Vibrio scophthalmi TaxID=45658 RepID=UPI0022852571|nr:NAD-dependent succinate-semialdehyde dehydrogenase [Vibrio scophthalmi]MCY9801818.1 NAD-dependent succinate-semialdehyde dehydrogenase [Vibrio scophthalmi]